jgi:hypothetical protein
MCANTTLPHLARGKRGVRWCALCALVIAATSGVARAEDASSDSDPRYRSTLKDALAEYDAGHFEEARALFRRAHEIYPNARTLRSIGMASFELRDYVAAVRALTAALSETRRALSPEQRAHAQGLLDRSRMFVDVYSIKIVPPDARTLVDGRVPEFERDGTLLLGFGNHNIEVSKPGYMLRTIEVNVRGNEHKDLAVTLERKSTAPAKPAPTDLVSRENNSGKQKRPVGQHGLRSGTIWLLSAGGAALLSVGAGALWLFQNNELSDCRNPPDRLQCDNKSAVTSRRNLAVGASVGAGAVALGLAIVGIVRSSSDSDGKPPATHSRLACSPTLNGVVCSTSF